MPKYPKEIQEKAVKMAKEGVHLKTIQTELGPNPKATMRYLAKVGINYTDLKAELKADGKEPKTLIKESLDKAERRRSKAKVSDKKKAAKQPKELLQVAVGPDGEPMQDTVAFADTEAAN